MKTDKLSLALKIENVSNFDKPEILMNEDDFNELVGFNKNNVSGWVESENPTYEGYPVKTSRMLEKGRFIVYDAKYQEW